VSATDNTVKDWRDETATTRREAVGMVRHMAVTLTAGSIWRVMGHLMLDSSTREAHDATVYQGIGFFGRPKANANVEAIVVFPGGAANAVVIAVRDEDARRAVANLEQNSTAMYNTVSIILIKPDGTVEIRATGGVAGPLVTRAEFLSHGHATAANGPVSPPILAPAPGSAVTFPGTTILKAQ
jgi:hypothetical protein